MRLVSGVRLQPAAASCGAGPHPRARSATGKCHCSRTLTEQHKYREVRCSYAVFLPEDDGPVGAVRWPEPGHWPPLALCGRARTQADHARSMTSRFSRTLTKQRKSMGKSLDLRRFIRMLLEWLEQELPAPGVTPTPRLAAREPPARFPTPTSVPAARAYLHLLHPANKGVCAM